MSENSNSQENMNRLHKMGEALNKWGVEKIAVWQVADRSMGRDYVLRIYPESRDFFEFIEQ